MASQTVSEQFSIYLVGNFVGQITYYQNYL